MFEDRTTYYNADRTRWAEIGIAETYWADDIAYSILKPVVDVYSSHKMLINIYDVEEKNQLDTLSAYEKVAREALDKGDRVYWIEIYDHSLISVIFHEFTFDHLPHLFCRFDSTLAGMMIVRREKWKTEFGPIFTKAYIDRKIDQCKQWLDGYINGYLYEVYVHDEVEDYGLGLFCSEEDAIEAKCDELPDCIYTDDDFDKEISVHYSLKQPKPSSMARA